MYYYRWFPNENVFPDDPLSFFASIVQMGTSPASLSSLPFNSNDLGQDNISRLVNFHFLLSCFRRDSHKIDSFLKVLRCRASKMLPEMCWSRKLWLFSSQTIYIHLSEIRTGYILVFKRVILNVSLISAYLVRFSVYRSILAFILE